jgi:hypothetical protein
MTYFTSSSGNVLRSSQVEPEPDQLFMSNSKKDVAILGSFVGVRFIFLVCYK